jgi:hypothetical protein
MEGHVQTSILHSYGFDSENVCMESQGLVPEGPTTKIYLGNIK